MNLPRYVNLVAVIMLVLMWVGIVTFLRTKKKKSHVYLIFFTIFYIYLFKVLDYTLLQFQTLLLFKHFMPGLILNGQTAGEELNLIPLITLTSEDLQTSFLNILLFIPFGFGLPFITDFRMKKIVIIGAIASIFIEILQFVTGYIAQLTFRVADINDLIFNTLGTGIGYIVFVGVTSIFKRISQDWKSSNPVMQYIIERPQIREQ